MLTSTCDCLQYNNHGNKPNTNQSNTVYDIHSTILFGSEILAWCLVCIRPWSRCQDPYLLQERHQCSVTRMIRANGRLFGYAETVGDLRVKKKLQFPVDYVLRRNATHTTQTVSHHRAEKLRVKDPVQKKRSERV